MYQESFSNYQDDKWIIFFIFKLRIQDKSYDEMYFIKTSND